MSLHKYNKNQKKIKLFFPHNKIFENEVLRTASDIILTVKLCVKVRISLTTFKFSAGFMKLWLSDFLHAHVYSMLITENVHGVAPIDVVMSEKEIKRGSYFDLLPCH